MKQEVSGPAKSCEGRAGRAVWGRRPGRGCKEEWAPCSWKAGCEEVLWLQMEVVSEGRVLVLHAVACRT